MEYVIVIALLIGAFVLGQKTERGVVFERQAELLEYFLKKRDHLINKLNFPYLPMSDLNPNVRSIKAQYESMPCIGAIGKDQLLDGALVIVSTQDLVRLITKETSASSRIALIEEWLVHDEKCNRDNLEHLDWLK